jgi:hypothetical protein
MEDKEVKDQNESKRNALIKYFSKLINKIKNIGKKNEVKMLPAATQYIKEESTSNNSRNEFMKRLRVSQEELSKNREGQQTKNNIQIRQGEKEGPGLDD